MNRQELGSSAHRKITRIDDTVHRPTGWWTPAVHDLLQFLESVDFPYSPRVLGFDEQGFEVLGFIPGESGSVGWTKIITDDGLRKYARLLKSYHDAVANYQPSIDAHWAYSQGGVKPDEILCHGDFGPWNLVWDGSDPIGILDWDMVTPASASHDILYALEYGTPFRDDETTLRWHHFSAIPDRKHRIKIFTEAYGIPPIQNLTQCVASVQRKVAKSMKFLADAGMQPQHDWVENGALNEAEGRAQWTESHSQLFE
jgi:Phosphotransferase enzyme family